MKAFSLAVVAVLLLLVPACGKPTQESVMHGVIDETNRVADILETVRDKASAEAAASRLQSSVKRFVELRKEMKQLKDPDPSTQRRLQEQFHQPLLEAQKHLAVAMRQVQSVPGAAQILGKAMQKLNEN